MTLYQNTDEIMEKRFKELFYGDLCTVYKSVKEFQPNEKRINCEEFLKEWKIDVFTQFNKPRLFSNLFNTISKNPKSFSIRLSTLIQETFPISPGLTIARKNISR